MSEIKIPAGPCHKCGQPGFQYIEIGDRRCERFACQYHMRQIFAGLKPNPADISPWAPTDREAVPEQFPRGVKITLSILIIAYFTILSMAWIPATESLANAYRAHTEEMIRSRTCEDTTKPVTRRAVR